MAPGLEVQYPDLGYGTWISSTMLGLGYGTWIGGQLAEIRLWYLGWGSSSWIGGQAPKFYLDWWSSNPLGVWYLD